MITDFIYNAYKNAQLKKEMFLTVIYTLKNQRLKVTQFDKARFIKVNELKLSQIELFSFFHFMCAAANASELFCMGPFSKY